MRSFERLWTSKRANQPSEDTTIHAPCSHSKRMRVACCYRHISLGQGRLFQTIIAWKQNVRVAEQILIGSDDIAPHLFITEMRLNFPIKLIFSYHIGSQPHCTCKGHQYLLNFVRKRIIFWCFRHLLSCKLQITIKRKTHGHLFTYISIF